jgi:putative transposase
MTPSNPYRGFGFPAEVIQHAAWLYHCFSLSLRDIETILAARGIVGSYETIRDWSLRFGQTFANAARRRRHRLAAKNHRAAHYAAFDVWHEVTGVASEK